MSAHRYKPCKDCGDVLTLRHFYKHSDYADGHMNTCKRCKIAYTTENAELKAEYYREQKRRIAARDYAREQRLAYARSERGREVHRAANLRYRRFKQMEARA